MCIIRIIRKGNNLYKWGAIMIKYYEARIEWIAHEQGGRKEIPPEGTRYCPLIKINGEDCSIDFICPEFSVTSIIKFKFFSNQICYNLSANDSYELFEGEKKVAIIKLL